MSLLRAKPLVRNSGIVGIEVAQDQHVFFCIRIA